MTDLQRGIAPPKVRKARPVLAVGRPLFEQALAGGKFDFLDIANARVWGNALVVQRNRWDINRRRSGLFSGRIKKADADAGLKRALEALEGGAE